MAERCAAESETLCLKCERGPMAWDTVRGRQGQNTRGTVGEISVLVRKLCEFQVGVGYIWICVV